MNSARIEKAVIQGISCLIISGDLLEPAPIVFFVHGFESDRRQGIPLGYELAKKGLLFVSIDTILRGERVDQHFDPAAGPDFLPVYPEETGLDGFITMLRMIRQVGLDIQTLANYFRNDTRIDIGRLGLVGYSMGGWAAFYSAAELEEVRAAVSVAGTPCFEQRWLDILLECSTNPDWNREMKKVEVETARRTAFIQGMDPYSTLIDKFPTPLLMICGEVDHVAPKKYCLDLYRQIRDTHGPDNLELTIYDGIDHQLTLAMAEETADWFGDIFKD